MTTQIRQFGEYHWQILRLVETTAVTNHGLLLFSVLEQAQSHHPVGAPTSWQCMRELEAAGLLFSEPKHAIALMGDSTFGNATIRLTDRGWRIAGQLRRWLAEGEPEYRFKPDEPPAVEDADQHQSLHDAVHRANANWQAIPGEWVMKAYNRWRDAAKSPDEVRQILYGDWSLPQDRADAILKAQADYAANFFRPSAIPVGSLGQTVASHRWEIEQAAFSTALHREYRQHAEREKLAGRPPLLFGDWVVFQLQLTNEALVDLYDLMSDYDFISDAELAAQEADDELRQRGRYEWAKSKWAHVLGVIETAKVMMRRMPKP